MSGRGALARVGAPLAIAASLVLGMSGCAPALEAGSVEVSAETIVLDVRTPAEFAAGHLDGAVNLDVQDPAFDERAAELEPGAGYVVYCRSGNRSATAVARLEALGFTSLVDAGGLDSAARATGLAIVG